MKKNNIICELEENDLPQLQQILFEVFNNNISFEEMKNLYKNVETNSDIHVLGYYIDDTLVGTVTLNILTMPSGREATIWDLAIKNNYRRSGIATKLMIHAEKIAKTESIKRIWLFSGFHRENAHKLYKKLGYNENRDKAFVKEFQI